MIRIFSHVVWMTALWNHSPFLGLRWKKVAFPSLDVRYIYIHNVQYWTPMYWWVINAQIARKEKIENSPSLHPLGLGFFWIGNACNPQRSIGELVLHQCKSVYYRSVVKYEQKCTLKVTSSSNLPIKMNPYMYLNKCKICMYIYMLTLIRLRLKHHDVIDYICRIINWQKRSEN